MQIKLIKNSERRGTDYIEFIVGGEDIIPKNWQDNAYFLSSSVYTSFFGDCFINKIGQEFDFVGRPTSYNDEELVVIAGMLNRNKKLLESIKNVDDFVRLANKYGEFTKELDYEKIDWGNDLQEVIRQLKEVCQDLIEIVQYCLDNNKVLWVLGV